MIQDQSQTEALPGVARVNVLGVGISPLNMDEAVESLIDSRVHGRSGYVCVTGVHGVIESQRDSELKQIHNNSLLTVPDGMPTVWMGREQGFVHMGRVYGPDLMLQLMAATSEVDGCSLIVDKERDGVARVASTTRQFNNPTTAPAKPESLATQPASVATDNMRQQIEPNGLGSPNNLITEKKCLSHFLYGATEEMLAELKQNLESRFPGIQIVGTYAPPFRPLNEQEEEELRQVVSGCKPDFFWVGLSTPKQEIFMAGHDPRLADSDFKFQVSSFKPRPLDCGIMLGVGAAFPIHAGLQKDAPEWIKNSGLQWFHRLCQEPRRLWRRYLDIVPTFLWLATMQLLGIRKYSLED